MLQLPELERSIWRESFGESLFPALTDEILVDVAVIGGGITGLTTAYLLKRSGCTVAVLEKRTVGSGTTGRTTGKVTSQHNLIYTDFAERLDLQTALLYGTANQAAVEQVAQIIKTEKIKCQWQRQDNYVYTTAAEQVPVFKREAKIARELRLPASFVKTTPLPFPIQAAVRFSNQGSLNAQQYLLGLARAIDGDGSHVFEHSRASRIHDGETARVKTSRGSVVARHIVVATNVPTLPLLARGGYCALEYPTESYIVAGELTKSLAGMYISPDRNHYSILPFSDNGARRVLVGGESHISGLRGNTLARYERLARYAEERLGVVTITHRWSDRDYLSYDGPPLIGKLYPWSKHLYVATAFRKWGLSNGTVAGMILRDLILGEPNEWSKIFNPQRLKPIKSIPRVARQKITGS